MFNSGVRLVGREVGPWGGWPPDQAAAHATLAPDRNPPGETAAGAPSSMPDSRFGTFASILDLWCPIRDFSDYFHISPSGFDNWLKRISAVIQD